MLYWCFFVEDFQPPFFSSSVLGPPTEETLLQNTLWPEIHKLYGHGYELFCLASDPQYELLASASRAQQAAHASIFIWSVKNQTQVCQLNAHNLTVTQMSFSPDGQRLVSVSRDRSWAVHEKCQVDGVLSMKTVARGSGGSRILWSCDWSPDSCYFVTGSRDKCVAVWTAYESSYVMCGPPLECQDSVTAVTFANKVLENGSFIVAVGLDNGKVCLYYWNPKLEENQWKLIFSLNQWYITFA